MGTQTAGSQEKTKTANPLKELAKFGQSVWLDYIREKLADQRGAAAAD